MRILLVVSVALIGLFADQSSLFATLVYRYEYAASLWENGQREPYLYPQGSENSAYIDFIEPSGQNINSLDGFSKSETLASVSVNYKCPMDVQHRMSKFNCALEFTEFNDLPACHRFAASVVMFASMLKNSQFTKAVTWNDAIILANESFNKDDALQVEFVSLIEKAKKIYAKTKKKKGVG